jgi:membrane protein DedA with SNARE-associated domain
VIDTATHLPGVLKSLEPVLNKSGYLAVAGFVLFEDFGVPVPGETILIVGALYAGTGRLSLPLVVLFGFLAAVTGDNIGFAIGHFGGRPLLARYGRYVLLSPPRIDKATALFDRHGGKVIVAARFIEGLRQASGIVAGVASVPWKRFLAFNAIGAGLWVGLWTVVGYFSGSHIDEIYRYATRYDTYLAVGVAGATLAYATRWLWKMRLRRAHGRGVDALPAGRDDRGAEHG